MMLTSEGFEVRVRNLDEREQRVLLAHDQAQRAVIAKLEEYEVTYLYENHKLKEKIEQQAKELERLQEVTTAWRNIQQEEMCYVMREIEALGIDINKSVISDGKALWDVCMERIAELRKAEQENTTLREALQYYADMERWGYTTSGGLHQQRCLPRTDIAQHALKEVS